MVSSHLDQHTTQKGFVEISGNKITLFTPSHIQYAAYGRGPGKKPPLDSMLRYVKTKGIIFANTDARGTAFAMQSIIAKKGTANWVPNAPNVIDEAIEKEIAKYSETLSKAFVIEVNEEVKKFNETLFDSYKQFKY